MKKLIFITLLIATQIFATDIQLKNGKVITNIEITKETETYIEFYIKDSKQRIAREDIARIRVSPVRKDRPSKEINANGTSNFEQEKIIIGYHQPYYLLPVAAVSFLIGWDYLSNASDLQDAIETSHNLDPTYDTSVAESLQSRQQIIGYASLIAGVALTYISFQSFNVYATPKSITVSYNF